MKKAILLICFGTYILNFSQITEQINTSNFQNTIVPPSTHVDGLNQSSLQYQEITLPEFKEPEIVNYQTFPKPQNTNTSSKADQIVEDMFPNKNKIDLTTTVDIRETHEKKPNSNIWVPKKTETDNEEKSLPQHSSNKAKSSGGNGITILLGILLVIIVSFTGWSMFNIFKNKYNYNKNNIAKTKIIINPGGCFQMIKLVSSVIGIIYILFLIFKGCAQ